MKSSKLLKIIRTLSKEDQEEFSLFLNSPYFHRDRRKEETCNLWKYIEIGLGQEVTMYWRKERIYQYLYPEEEWIKGKIEKLMTKLFALLKTFIIQKQREQAGAIEDLLLLNSYYSKYHQYSFFETTLKKLKKKLTLSKKQDTSYFYHQFLVEELLSEFQSLHNNRRIDLNLPATHHSLDLYYLLTKLEYACQLLSIHLFIVPLEIKESLELLDLLLVDTPQRYLEAPIILLYYHAYCLLRSFKNMDEVQYQSFYNLLKQYEKEIEDEQLKPLRTLIRNYCISHYLQGNMEYLNKAFHLYQEDLNEGYLYYNDRLLPGTMNNMVGLGLRMGAFDWVIQFLEKHRDRTYGTDTPEITYQFNLAHYHFHIKNYEKALEYLSVTFEDQYYRISARRLEIMIYYTMKSILLDAKINAFKLYIYRMPKQSVSVRQKQGNGNFIDLLKQICLPRTFQSHTRIEKLILKISGTELLAERLWLLEILEALR